MSEVLYFGPLNRPGHYLFDREDGYCIHGPEDFPWCGGSGIDGVLQPGCYQNRWGRWEHGREIEGEALVHHKDGWTALSFWDRSIDPRPASNSTYFARGALTFAEIVELAKQHYPRRWACMKFEVREMQPAA